MTKEEVRKLFDQITVWKQGDKRAPHKPLLILYILGRIFNGYTDPVSFQDVDVNVGKLLDEFGPPNKTQALYPFWYLQNDDIWNLSNMSPSPGGHLGACPTKTMMRNNDVHGSFPSEIHEILNTDRTLLLDIAGTILHSHFPRTMHEDILQAAGITTGVSPVPESEQTQEETRTRDPKFREKVLRAYEYRCAVCGFDIRVGNDLIGLEAAHIKWHAYGGPDKEQNGLALCSLHHKLFDRGAFSLSTELIFLVSENAHGSESFDDWLMRFHGQKLRNPLRSTYLPDEEYASWHIREVFRGEAREFFLI